MCLLSEHCLSGAVVLVTSRAHYLTAKPMDSNDTVGRSGVCLEKPSRFDRQIIPARAMFTRLVLRYPRRLQVGRTSIAAVCVCCVTAAHGSKFALRANCAQALYETSSRIVANAVSTGAVGGALHIWQECPVSYKRQLQLQQAVEHPGTASAGAGAAAVASHSSMGAGGKPTSAAVAGTLTCLFLPPVLRTIPQRPTFVTLPQALPVLHRRCQWHRLLPPAALAAAVAAAAVHMTATGRSQVPWTAACAHDTARHAST